MDSNLLMERNRRALSLQEKAGSEEERRAYRQFARDYSVQIQLKQTENSSVDGAFAFPNGHQSQKSD